MKNYEKYADEIRELKSNIGTEWCELFAKPKVLKPLGRKCEKTACGHCTVLTLMWLLEEYEEPETDWSKVEVDTPILVRQGKTGGWLERHFAKYENGEVYAWVDGQTSWAGADKIKWRYAKLAENEEPEIDWNEVKVDTPILVRDNDDDKWIRRYFATHDGKFVYAWNGGCTSWTEEYTTGWKYAKLAESEEE